MAVCFELFDELEATTPRHHKVRNDEVRPLGECSIDAFLAVASLEDGVPAAKNVS